MPLSLSLGLSLGSITTATPWSISGLYSGTSGGDYWDASNLSEAVDATVQSIAGKRGLRTFTQATEGSRPVKRQRTDGALYLDFSGGKSSTVLSSTALFNFLHDGTGGSWWAVVEWPATSSVGYIFTTCGSTSQNGIQISKSTAGQHATVYVCRSTSGVFAATGTESRMPAANGRITVLIGSYKNNGGASDFQLSFDQAKDIVTGATLNAPNTGNAGQSLSIPSTFGGNVYAWGTIDKELSIYERQALAEHMIQRFEYRAPQVDLCIAIAGQSNGSGRGAIDSSIPAPMDGVFILDKSRRVRRSYEPSHSLLNQYPATDPTEPTPSAPAISPVLTAGRALKARGLTSMWVPRCVGGTGAADWDTPATAGDITTLLGSLVVDFKAARSEKGGSPILIWDGHEGNASLAIPDYPNGGVGTAYQTLITDLIANVRAALGWGDIPVILTQLAARDSLANSVIHAAAAEAQRQLELSIPNCFMLVQHDLARNAGADDIHISRAGQYVKGARLDRIIAQAHGLEVNGKGPRIVSLSRAGAVITLTLDKAVNTTAGNYGDLFRVYDGGVEATVSSAARGANTSTVEIACSATLTEPVTLTYGFRAGAASAARTDFVADGDGLPLPLFGPIAVPAA